MGRAWRRDLPAFVIGSILLALAVGGGRAAFAAATIRVPADFPTIQAAINAAQTGDVIVVSPGTYREVLDIRNKSITLASEFYVGGDPAAIAGTILEPPVGPGIAIQRSVSPQARVVGFTIRNTTGTSIDGIRAFGPAEILDNRIVGFVDGLDFVASSTGPPTAFVVRGNSIENSTDDAIDLNGPITAVIEANLLSGSADDGIEVRFHDYGTRLDLAIRENTITASRQDGIQMIDELGVSNRHVTIERNVFASIGRAGIGLMDNGVSSEDYRAASLPDEIFLFNNTFNGTNHAVSGGDNVVAVNNLFVNSVTLGLKGVNGSSIAAYNLFWGNGTNASASNVDETTTIVANPLLAGDHTLLEGSPAVDAGTAVFDWNGVRVLDLPSSAYAGPSPDLGARERPTTAVGPETTITQAPPTSSSSTSATFGFSANVAGSTFECALDTAELTACTAPVTYSGLAEGSHTFQVRATDPGGATDNTPATRSWTVDTVAPDTTIDSAPPETATESTATFAFGSSESGSTFACSLDGGAYAACASPKTYAAVANGSHTFAVRASDAAGNIDATPATHAWSVAAPTTRVLAVAGNIGECVSGAPAAGTEATAALLDSLAPDAVLALGDNAYEHGSLSDYLCSYAPTWGRHLERTYPIPGNHEYETPNASGYFQYFGDRAGDPATGYYSYDLGGWHLIALNSECAAIGGCGPGSPQEVWLRQDLAAAATSCIAAYWHTPLFSSASFGSGNAAIRPLYQALHDYGADLLLVGHDHFYERFARQSPTGAVDLAGGVRQFIVGTGGRGLHILGAPAANSEVRSPTHGVLKVVLRSGGYDWQFFSRAGQLFTDSGSDTCTGTPPDTVAPASPTTLAASGLPSAIELTWAAPTDNVGVIAHDVYRNGTLIGSSTAASTFRDTAVVAGIAYTYEVRARDAAGNSSGPSNSASATASAVILTFAPDADARVEQGVPNTNFGTSTALIADLSPHTETFVRFTVSGVTGTVTSAKLRLFAYGGTVDGPAVYSTSGSWSETAITWNTKPQRIGGALGDSGAVATSTWVEYDVTAALQGNGSYAFNLVPTSGDGVDFYSRQAASRRPELVVSLGGDLTPPETSIVSGASGTVTSPSATFAFAATEEGSTFACALDGGAYVPCSSPRTYAGLADGGHAFAVRATDPVGNTDATPATRTWTIDTAPPETTITSGPSDSVNTSSADFGFGASEPDSVFHCALDGAEPTPCSSPTVYSDLAEGSHTFSVQAADAAGNADPSPATRTWTIDTSAPPPPVIASPADGAALTSATVTFSGTAEPATTIELFDGGVSRALTSSDAAGSWQATLSDVGDGPHGYTATAIDPAGNTSPASTAVNVNVETGPPETTITSGPSGSVNTSNADFGFGASEPDSVFHCALDGAEPTPCSSPTVYSDLAEGSHTFSVQATDAAGNAEPSPATRTWTIDTVAPETTLDSGPSGTVTSGIATFAFSANEAAAAFECALDGAAYAACASPKTYSGLADGQHAFSVRAVDPAGNSDVSPASWSWTVLRPAPRTLAFTAVADARVEQQHPTTNYGTSTSLLADLSPVTEASLRFNVTGVGVTGTVTSAKLRLFVTNTTPNAPAVHSAANAWAETGVTWNTRPLLTSAALDNEGAVAASDWLEYNVLAAVSADGTYTFTLVADSTNGLTVRSREASSNRPQLVLEVTG